MMSLAWILIQASHQMTNRDFRAVMSQTMGWPGHLLCSGKQTTSHGGSKCTVEDTEFDKLLYSEVYCEGAIFKNEKHIIYCIFN